MLASFKRILFIVNKEATDFKTNFNQFMVFLLPVALAAVYQYTIPDFPEHFPFVFGLMMLIVMIGIIVPGMMIAEEKEKKTISTLICTPASVLEILLGKSLLTIILICVDTLLLMLIDGSLWQHTLLIFVSTLIISIFCIILGIITGIFAPTQMATGVWGCPMCFVLLLPPLFAVMDVKIMQTISTVIPTYYYLEMLIEAISHNKTLILLLPQTGIIIGSTLVVFALLLLIYNNKGLGE